jgi:HSP20 family protein
MFNNIWSEPSLSRGGALEEGAGFFYPDVEMSETNGHIEISAELPGVTDKDIDVTLSPDGTTLAIKGEKKLSKEKKEKDYYCAERSYGAFRRTMSLPTPVNPDKVDAKFHHGVLEIKLTKVDDSSKGVKHIDIKAS